MEKTTFIHRTVLYCTTYSTDDRITMTIHVHVCILQLLSVGDKDTNLQGVPQLSSHFVLVVFSASRARTEEYFTIFQQPRRCRFQNSPYFPPYIKN